MLDWLPHVLGVIFIVGLTTWALCNVLWRVVDSSVLRRIEEVCGYAAGASALGLVPFILAIPFRVE